MDHSSVTSSPRLIAGSYVLHRLLVPRHPPCALNNLTTKTQRCSRPLCSSQHTSSTTPHNPHPPTPPTSKQHTLTNKLQRPVVCGPGADHHEKPHPHPPPPATHTRTSDRRAVPQDPTACLTPTPTPPTPRSHHTHPPRRTTAAVLARPGPRKHRPRRAADPEELGHRIR